MCSVAGGARSRVMTSAAGCARGRVVTLEKKLIFCSCAFFVFTRLVYKILAVVSLKSGAANDSSFMRSPCLNGRAFNPDTSDTRARTSFVILLERLVIEMGTPVLRL